MGSDDRPGNGPTRTGGSDRERDPPVFEMTHQELKTTFDYQVQRLREIDNKAIEILKANLFLIGILITGGSILVQTDLEIGVFVNVFTVFGGVLLLLSTGVAAVTYTASNLRGGLDTEAVEAAVAVGIGSTTDLDDRPDREFRQRLLRSYARWIEYNARVIAVNDILATVTVLFVFIAFVYVVVGAVVAVAAVSTAVTWGVFVVTTLLLGVFFRLAYRMDHLGLETDRRPETFEGVRLSKGAAREEGWSILIGMVRHNPNDDVDP